MVENKKRKNQSFFQSFNMKTNQPSKTREKKSLVYKENQIVQITQINDRKQ